MNRTQNSTRNIIFSLGSMLVSTILTFANRTVFIHSLGLNYLGLNGLYSNILSFLSIAELGIGNAISFSLYKPLAQNNTDKIASYMNLFRRCYLVIGSIILAMGLMLVPYLDYFVNFDITVDINYYNIYYLFLLNTIVPYFLFSYKITILYADQKAYMVSKKDMLYQIVTTLFQLIALFVFKNYYLYLIIGTILITVKNYSLSRTVEKLYPMVKKGRINKLTRQELNNLMKNVFSLSLTKISGVVYSSTDNIIISTFIDTLTVGLYSNYTMIVNVLKGVIAAFFNSFTASIGNLNAEENSDKLFDVFKKLNFVNFWLYGYLFIGLNCLLNVFISVWVGDYAVFSKFNVFLICLMFLIPGLNNVINIFKDACGLYWQTKYRAVATALVNLVLSLILVKKMGISGVFLGTIIAYLTTIYVKDPVIVFKECFNKKVLTYYIELLVRVSLILVLNLLANQLVDFMSIYFDGIILFFISGIGITIIVNIVFCSLFYKTDEFIFFRNIIFDSIRKII
mgnify:CR=1 FL=1